MAVAQLGSLKWRIDPSAINWSYQIDANRIETLGGQVVQILGATLSDLTITGFFGQDHSSATGDSWRLAAAFQQKIKLLIDAQTLPAKTVNSVIPGTTGGNVTDADQIHKPIPFTFHDGIHDWSFNVLVKSIADKTDTQSSLTHTVGKISYGYVLTLFIVEDKTDITKVIASDQFISRISAGLGWVRSEFNGHMNTADLQAFLSYGTNGGSVTSYLQGILVGTTSGAPPVTSKGTPFPQSAFATPTAPQAGPGRKAI